MEPQFKQAKSETCNYTKSNLNDFSKAKVPELVKSLLKFNCLGMDFLDHANNRSLTERPKHLTFKY